MEEERMVTTFFDDLEQAIDRYSEDMEDFEIYIRTDIVKQLLDHFMPKWRKRTDRYYKLKKFVTEQQLDRNISKIRNEMNTKEKELRDEIVKLREFIDEFEANAAEVSRIIEQDRIAVKRIRMRKEGK